MFRRIFRRLVFKKPVVVTSLNSEVTLTEIPQTGHFLFLGQPMFVAEYTKHCVDVMSPKTGLFSPSDDTLKTVAEKLSQEKTLTPEDVSNLVDMRGPLPTSFDPQAVLAVICELGASGSHARALHALQFLHLRSPTELGGEDVGFYVWHNIVVALLKLGRLAEADAEALKFAHAVCDMKMFLASADFLRGLIHLLLKSRDGAAAAFFVKAMERDVAIVNGIAAYGLALSRYFDVSAGHPTPPALRADIASLFRKALNDPLTPAPVKQLLSVHVGSLQDAAPRRSDSPGVEQLLSNICLAPYYMKPAAVGDPKTECHLSSCVLTRNSRVHNGARIPAEELGNTLANLCRRNANVMFLTGSGISKASKLATRQDLWRSGNYDRDECVSIWKFHEDPARLWNLIRDFLAPCQFSPKPNEAHEALGRLAWLLRAPIVTQNVDHLHEDAFRSLKLYDALSVIPLHGCLRQWRCLACDETSNVKWAVYQKPYPDVIAGWRCDVCGHDKPRPDVVLFGETPRAVHVPSGVFGNMISYDALVVVGTAGDVHPASTIIDTFRNFNKSVFEINTEAHTTTMCTSVIGDAEIVLPKVLSSCFRGLEVGRSQNFDAKT